MPDESVVNFLHFLKIKCSDIELAWIQNEIDKFLREYEEADQIKSRLR